MENIYIYLDQYIQERTGLVSESEIGRITHSQEFKRKISNVAVIRVIIVLRLLIIEEGLPELLDNRSYCYIKKSSYVCVFYNIEKRTTEIDGLPVAKRCKKNLTDWTDFNITNRRENTLSISGLVLEEEGI